jgi:integrase
VIARTPCTGIKLPKVERRHVVPLEVDAVTALADAIPARYHALVVHAAGTGLRQGECFGLTVDRVDFLRRTLTVAETLDMDSHLWPDSEDRTREAVDLVLGHDDAPAPRSNLAD